MEGAPMAGKHVMDIRLPRVPARASTPPQITQSSKPNGRPPPTRGTNNRGGSQARNREARGRDLTSKADADEEEEEDYSHLLLDAYQDDRKGGRRHEKSLNHLLNFHYAERAKAEAHPPPQRKVFNKPFRKEAFVQANYRFIMSNTGRTTTLLEDVNQAVDWDLIEQVLLWSAEPYNCPICLDTPVAARITKCGHIYCAACILRYLGESAAEWRRCPICFESVSRSHLKCAAIQSVKAVAEGDQASLVLLQRYRTSCVLIPRTQWAAATGRDSFRRFDDPFAMYARIVVASDLLALLSRQESEVSEAVSLGRASGDESLPYLLLAQEELQMRQQKLKSEMALSKGPAQEISSKSDGWNESSPSSATSAPSLPISAPHPAPLASAAETRKQLVASTDQGAKDDMIFIYQAADGQLVFLHPLDVRCLLREFGSPEGFPDSLAARVVEVEEFVLSEALRKRHKHLAHLPLSCTFSFVELDLTAILSPSTLAAFSAELARRAEMREQRLKERQQEQEVTKNTPVYRPEDFPAPEHMPVFDEVMPGDSAAAFEYPPLRASTSAIPISSPSLVPAASSPSNTSSSTSSSSSKPAAASAWRSMSSPNAASANSPPEGPSPSTLSFKAALSSDPPGPKLDKLPRKNKKQVIAFSNSGARKY